MRFFKTVSFAGILLFLLFQQTVNTGCTKPASQGSGTIDTITPPPPPAPVDTISYVSKLEVLTSLYPGYGITPYRTYSFRYDTQKRLTEVGIKNYSAVPVDTFTTKLAYTGSSKLPGRIITFNINNLFAPGALVYDTTYFFYTADGKLQKDSSNELFYNSTTSSYISKPFYRNYTYPDNNTGTIDWFWGSATTSPQLWRKDTVKLAANGKLQYVKALYQYYQSLSPAGPGSYALAEGFTYSTVINPLAKLNISGTPYSLIYTGVKNELLGNRTHPVVYNSNGFADYLDFISPVLPTLFYISGYNEAGSILGQGGTSFSIDITGWSVRPSYPAEIRVRINTSLAGDSYIYRYSY